VAKPELGTKRVCPTTGRRFYDMDRDPIVSPYTGQSFPRSQFEPQVKAPVLSKSDDEDEAELDVAAPELVSLDDVEAEEAGKDVIIDDDIEIEDDGEADDAFLADEEEGDDDVVGLIDGDLEDDEEA
jgi:uncharacterized protein (TIGR02300 family)